MSVSEYRANLQLVQGNQRKNRITVHYPQGRTSNHAGELGISYPNHQLFPHQGVWDDNHGPCLADYQEMSKGEQVESEEH